MRTSSRLCVERHSSTTATGTVIDLSSRKTTFADTHTNNPVLTAEEAATYTIATVMGSTDDWNPTALTEQASAPVNVKLTVTNPYGSYVSNKSFACPMGPIP